jgi:hypothetical protein
MKPITPLLIAVLSAVSTNVVAQEVEARDPEHPARVEVDSDYVQLFPKTITARVYLGEKISTFSIEDRKRGADLDYRPNNVLTLGVGVTYRGVGFNISTKLPFHDPKDDKFGSSKHIDFQLHRYRRKLALDFYAQRYKGFHLNNKSTVSSFPGTTEYPYYPNMRILTVGASAMYVFNGARYTMRAPVNQQDRQLRSAGSPMVGAAFYVHQISNGDSSIVPGSYYKPDMFDGTRPMEIHAYGLTLHVGYGYNYVINQTWFASAAADVGAGGGYVSSVEMSGKKVTSVDVQGRANVRFGIGYNANRWVFSLYGIAHGDRYTLPYENSQLGSTQGVIRLVAARRFDSKR